MNTKRQIVISSGVIAFLMLFGLLASMSSLNISDVKAQNAATETPVIGGNTTNNFDFSIASVPQEMHSAIIEMIHNRTPGVLAGGTYFVVGIFHQVEGLGYGTIGASIGNQPPDWGTSIQFIVYKKNGIWAAALNGTLEYEDLAGNIPNNKPSLIQSAATENKFPWSSSQSWCYTSPWHYSNSTQWNVDFAPSSSVPSGEQWFLSSADGYLSLTCNDGYQAFSKVQNGTLGNMGYGHLDANSIIGGIVNTSIPQGQKLAKAYNGTQGAGWYNIDAAWPWPVCTPNNSCNWGTRTGCCYLQYKTTCGAGTGAHFHWTLPGANTTVDGWTIGTDAIWRKSGQADRGVNACFSSSNTGDNTAPTTSHSLAGATGENGWYISAVQVTLTAADNSGGSGVNQTIYTIDPILPIDPLAWQTYSAPFPISTDDGNHLVYYKSKDVAGNWETEKSTAIKIDTVAPTGSFAIQNGSVQVYSTTIDLSTQANDVTSGVAGVRFRDVGQTTWPAWYTYNSSVFWQLIGSHGQSTSVEAQFKDKAGNFSSIYSDSVQINLYPARPSSAQYKLLKSTFGAAGVQASSGGYIMNGTVGQPSMVGAMQSANYQLKAGYWALPISSIYTISGNAGVAGVILTYTGGSTTADGSGIYSFAVSHGWTGTVTPSKTGYTFSPANKTYTNLQMNKTGENYTAIFAPYRIYLPLLVK